MALHLNLLHEQIHEQRERQRDPLKLAMFGLAGTGTLMFLYYGLIAYQTLEAKGQLAGLKRDWVKVEPKVTAAQKRVADLNNVIQTTRALDEFVENRFLWAPLLQKIAQCAVPNTQLTGLTGSAQDETRGTELTIEGMAAGREPRSVAEDLRQMLLEQLKRTYSDVKVEFKSLEDVDQIVLVSGTHMAMAKYTLSINFKPGTEKPSASPTPNRGKKK